MSGSAMLDQISEIMQLTKEVAVLKTQVSELQQAVTGLVEVMNDTAARTSVFMLTNSQIMLRKGVCTEAEWVHVLEESKVAVEEEQASAAAIAAEGA